VSRTPPRHRKPPQHASARQHDSNHPASARQHDSNHPASARQHESNDFSAYAPDQERSLAAPKRRRKPVRITAAVAGSALLVLAGVAVATHRHGPGTHDAALDQANSLNTRGATGGLGSTISSQSAAAEIAAQHAATARAAAQRAAAKRAAAQAAARRAAAARAAAAAKHAAADRAAAQRAKKQSQQNPTTSGYRNPLRAVGGLIMERVDQGVDFGGAGPVYALGNAVITNAMADNAGWPGGGWITYQLTSGPDKGLMVYLAEDVTPTVQAGQTVTSSTVIANMFNGGAGIETGWATSDGSTAESQTPEAGGINGNGPFPTVVGLSFESLLESLGVPAAPNASEPGNGLLPPGYPAVKS
jgi:hypothetical protein